MKLNAPLDKFSHLFCPALHSQIVLSVLARETPHIFERGGPGLSENLWRVTSRRKINLQIMWGSCSDPKMVIAWKTERLSSSCHFKISTLCSYNSQSHFPPTGRPRVLIILNDKVSLQTKLFLHKWIWDENLAWPVASSLSLPFSVSKVFLSPKFTTQTTLLALSIPLGTCARLRCIFNAIYTRRTYVSWGLKFLSLHLNFL